MLQVDASVVGAGAALLQADDRGVERPVGFFSRKFSPCQTQYSVVEQEALAFTMALQNFKVYVCLAPGPLVVYTDRNPPTFLPSIYNHNHRLMRPCSYSCSI